MPQKDFSSIRAPSKCRKAWVGPWFYFILFYFFLLLSVAGKKISQLGQGSVRISGCLSKLSSNISRDGLFVHVWVYVRDFVMLDQRWALYMIRYWWITLPIHAFKQQVIVILAKQTICCNFKITLTLFILAVFLFQGFLSPHWPVVPHSVSASLTFSEAVI